MKSLLVTGGAGFIGSNFIIYFLNRHKDWRIINIDALTYAGNCKNLSPVENDKNYVFVKGDICDRVLLESIFVKYDIRAVIHFAAESHVDNSISNPGVFVRTNVLGTYTVLDVAYRYWMQGPFHFRPGYEQARFHHISTDEVYGSLKEEGFFTEDSPYAPNSPYSASKAGSDMLVRSYFRTYGMNVVITNCSNNYGPRQHREKFIPTIIVNALLGSVIPVYGNGKNVRDWIYVLDHCEAIDIVFSKAKPGAIYNIGAMNEKRNIEVAELVCELLDQIKPKSDGTSYKGQIHFVKDRPGHDWRYAMDVSKIKNELGWSAHTSFIDGLKETIEWYLKELG